MAPQPLLSDVSGAARIQITIRGAPNRLNYCVIFIESTQFTNVAAVRITQSGGRGDGHPNVNKHPPSLITRDVLSFLHIMPLAL